MAIKLMPGEYTRQGGKKTVLTTAESLFGFLEPKANLLMVVSVILLLLSILASLGLWWYKTDINKQIGIVTSQIDELRLQRDPDLESKLMELDRNIKKLDEILEARIYPVNIFKILEDLALPEAYFSDFSVDLDESTISINVEALSYAKLAEQMVVFEKDPRISSFDFSGINLNDTGGAGSAFQLVIEPDLLSVKPN